VAEDNEENITTNVVSLFLLGFMLHPKLRETALEYKTQTLFTITAWALHEFAEFRERNALEDQIFATLNIKPKPHERTLRCLQASRSIHRQANGYPVATQR
jgi:hypothetical protein